MGLAFQAIYPEVYPVAYELFKSGKERKEVTVLVFMKFRTRFNILESEHYLRMTELSIACAENDYKNKLEQHTSGHIVEDNNISRLLGLKYQKPEIKKIETFRELERKKAEALIKSGWFNGDPGNGIFDENTYQFVLNNSDNNIFKYILNDVKLYFKENNIAWWKGKEPTGHTLSSQISCINHLFPLRNDKKAVLALLSSFTGGFIDVLPINTDKYLPAFISFEQISDNDLLNEGKPARGSNCTSIDACIYAVHKNGSKWIIPIEWKYTETYNDEDKGSGFSGEIRHKRYDGLIEKSSQLKYAIKENEKNCYYYEPFYQLMRQTLWAEQMVKNKNSETITADDYVHLHIIPQKNYDLLNKKYSCSNRNMRVTWRNCLVDKKKYLILSPGFLFNNFFRNFCKNYEELIQYLLERYWIDYE